MRTPKFCAICGKSLKKFWDEDSKFSFDIYTGKKLEGLKCPTEDNHSKWIRIPDNYNDDEYEWRAI